MQYAGWREHGGARTRARGWRIEGPGIDLVKDVGNVQGEELRARECARDGDHE